MWLPQRPYLVMGTLRDQVPRITPGSTSSSPRPRVRQAKICAHVPFSLASFFPGGVSPTLLRVGLASKVIWSICIFVFDFLNPQPYSISGGVPPDAGVRGAR